MANEDYIDEYRSLIPEYSAEIVSSAISLGSPISMPLPDDSPTTSVNKVKEDPFGYVPLSSADLNTFTNSLYTDLVKLYGSANFIDRTLVSMQNLHRDELSEMSNTIDGLLDRIDQFKYLRMGYAQGFSIIHHNTFDDDFEQETAEGYYINGISKAERDIREKRLRLPLIGDFNRIKPGSRVGSATISIVASAGDNLQYGYPLMAFNNLRNIKYAIDGSTDSYWGEVVLSDEQVSVPLTLGSVSASGGAICAFQIDFNDKKSFSHISLKPYCEYPLNLLAIFVAKREASSQDIDYDYSTGWYNTGIHVIAGVEYRLDVRNNISAMTVGNSSFPPGADPYPVSLKMKIGATGTATEIASGAIPSPGVHPVNVTPSEDGILYLRLGDDANAILISHAYVSHNSAEIGSIQLKTADALYNPTAVTGHSTALTPGYEGFVEIGVENTYVPIYKICDYSSSGFYIGNTTRITLPRQENVNKIVMLIQQPHYTRESFLISSEQQARQDLWQQMIGNFTELARLPLPGLDDTSNVGMSSIDKVKSAARAPKLSKNPDRMLQYDRYQYVYGFYDIGVSHRIYGSLGMYVSKPYETDKNLIQAALLADDDAGIVDIGGNSIEVGLVEYDISASDGNWIPILPLNRRFAREYFTVTTGATADIQTRMPATHIKSVEMLSDMHGIIEYEPRTSSRYVDLLRIAEMEIRPRRINETITTGTDRNGGIKLKKAPHINKGRIYPEFDPNGNIDAGDYVPVSVDIDGIELEYTDAITGDTIVSRTLSQDTTMSEYNNNTRSITTSTAPANSSVVVVSNGSYFFPGDEINIYTESISSKERNKIVAIAGNALSLENNLIVEYPIGSFVEKVGERGHGTPFIRNVTDYAGNALTALTPYHPANYPVVEYLHYDNMLYFNVSEYFILDETARVNVSYDRLIDNVRVRVTLKRHQGADTCLTPFINSYTLLLRDAKETSHEDRTSSGVSWGALYKIQIPTTVNKATGEPWRWVRLVNSGNGTDAVSLSIAAESSDCTSIPTLEGERDITVSLEPKNSLVARFEKVLGGRSTTTELYEGGLLSVGLFEWPYKIIVKLTDDEMLAFYNYAYDNGFFGMSNTGHTSTSDYVLTINAMIDMYSESNTVTQYTGHVDGFAYTAPFYDGTLKFIMNHLESHIDMSKVFEFYTLTTRSNSGSNQVSPSIASSAVLDWFAGLFGTASSGTAGNTYSPTEVKRFNRVVVYSNGICAAYNDLSSVNPAVYTTLTDEQMAYVLSIATSNDFFEDTVISNTASVAANGATDTVVVGYVNYGGNSKYVVQYLDLVSDDGVFEGEVPGWFTNIYNAIGVYANAGVTREAIPSQYLGLSGEMITSDRIVTPLKVDGKVIVIPIDAKYFEDSIYDLDYLVSDSGNTYNLPTSGNVVSATLTTDNSTMTVVINYNGSTSLEYAGQGTSYTISKTLTASQMAYMLNFADNCGFWRMLDANPSAGDQGSMADFNLTINLDGISRSIRQYSGHISGISPGGPPYFNNKIVDIFNLLYYMIRDGSISDVVGITSAAITASDSIYRDLNDDCHIELNSDGEVDPDFEGITYNKYNVGAAAEITLRPGEHALIGIPGRNVIHFKAVSSYPYNYLYSYEMTGVQPATTSDSTSQYYAPSVYVP